MDRILRTLLPPARERHLARNETLFRVGDPTIGLVLVCSGRLELVRTSPEGRRSVLHRADAGATFAEASLFEERHHCDAVRSLAKKLDRTWGAIFSSARACGLGGPESQA